MIAGAHSGFVAMSKPELGAEFDARRRRHARCWRKFYRFLSRFSHPKNQSSSLVTARVFFFISFCQSFKAVSSLSQPAAVVVFSLDDQYSCQGVETFLP